MADIKVSQLPEATQINDEDLLMIVQGNTNKKITKNNSINVGLATKQDTLVSGTNIKTINSTSLLGSGDINISGTDVKNTYSTSTNDAYSCDYINKVNTYSTNEVKTNKIWIDGKPIYRKVLIINHLPNTGSYQWSIGVANLDLVKINYGESYMTWTTPRTYSIMRVNPQIDFVIDNNKYLDVITVDGSYVNWTAYVVVEYTKTTD